MLGSALSPIAGEDIGQLTNFGIPVERLNVAFQGDIDYLPGLGPFVSIPLGLLMPDDWYGTLPDFVRSWAFPFGRRSEEHTSELQSLMRISYAVFCLKKK